MRSKRSGVILKLSETQVAKQGGFLAGLPIKFIASTLLKKVLPSLTLAVATGAISRTASKAVQGKGLITSTTINHRLKMYRS